MTWLQRIHYIWVRVGLVLLVALPIAMYLMFRAQHLPDDTFATTAHIDVKESDGYLRFEPRPRDGIQPARWMLIPGCPVDPRAYGPLARAVAERGFHSVIVKVPWRCAPWPQHVAELGRRVRALIDECLGCTWTLAGHSRGVRHVLEIVRRLPSTSVSSLILMASTHPRADYSDLPMPVVKILGSEDGVAPLDRSFQNRALLPADTRYEVIEGGNHAQFAFYGYQLFDGHARISREEQHRQVAELVARTLMRTD